MFRGIRNLWTTLWFLWNFRLFVWHFFCDFNDIVEKTEKLNESYKDGVAKCRDAQKTILSLLELRSIATFVQTTSSPDDEVALTKLKGVVENEKVFSIAWRILHGDWSIPIKQSRWGSFIDSVKKKLPFVDKTKAARALASVSEDQQLLSDLEEAGVTSVIGLVVIILNILPYIIEFIKKIRNR